MTSSEGLVSKMLLDFESYKKQIMSVNRWCEECIRIVN